MGARGPARTPTSDLALRGSWRAKARSKTEPDLETGAPPCPALVYEDEGTRAWYAEKAAELAAAGIMTSLDADMLGMVANARFEYLQAVEAVQREGFTVAAGSGGTKAHPALAARDKAAERFMRGLAQFGMSAATRSNVTAIRPRSRVQSRDRGKARFFDRAEGL